jgi:hypothetical protein
MPEPNTSDRNSHGSRVHEISDRKIAARFPGRLPTTRCGEEDRRLLRFSNGFWFLHSRSITHADRDGGRKLARLRRGFESLFKAAIAAHVPVPVAAYERQLADECRMAGGTPAQPSPGFVARGDLNGDGIDDWAFDESKFNCTAAAGIYGGAGGSQIVVFVGLPGGGARQAFQHGAYGMKLQRIGTTDTLWLRVGGPLCGQTGNTSHAEAISCDRPLTWDQARQSFDFAPLTRARFPSHIRE